MKIQLHKAESRLNLQDLETDLPHAIHWCALTSEAVWDRELHQPMGELLTQTCKMKIALKTESNVLRKNIFASYSNIAVYQNIQREK